ncbi:MAG: VOC family protein [Frankia sp.]
MNRPQLNLLVLYTSDVANCRAFYEELGLEFTAERHGDGPEHAAASLADGAVLEIYPAGRKTPTGTLRIGFTLPAGQRSAIQLSVGRHLLRDPDGRAVEVSVSAAPESPPGRRRRMGRRRSSAR